MQLIDSGDLLGLLQPEPAHSHQAGGSERSGPRPMSAAGHVQGSRVFQRPGPCGALAGKAVEYPSLGLSVQERGEKAQQLK